MPSVTIIGAGVFGLSIAHSLPVSYNVTIVARDMPGDPDSLNWASPWAGAGFGFGAVKDETERDIMMASFRYFWELAERYPESTVKKITENLFRDNTDTDEDLWYRTIAPDYRIMETSELPPSSRARIALSYTSLVLNPPKYIVWLAERLHARGVTFTRGTVESLAQVKSGKFGPVPDVIVNATGVGARDLGGVQDPDVEPIRGQTILIADPENKITTMILRSGIDYCYIIPRLDGTVVIGGIKEPGDLDPNPKPHLRNDICERAHELNPLIPSSPADLTVVRDIVGFRPGRKTGPRVESEIINNINVVHAYGGGGGGYALSAGVGRRVAFLVDELLQGGAKRPNESMNETKSTKQGGCKVQ